LIIVNSETLCLGRTLICTLAAASIGDVAVKVARLARLQSFEKYCHSHGISVCLLATIQEVLSQP